jgi:hypothetical protein
MRQRDKKRIEINPQNIYLAFFFLKRTLHFYIKSRISVAKYSLKHVSQPAEHTSTLLQISDFVMVFTQEH